MTTDDRTPEYHLEQAEAHMKKADLAAAAGDHQVAAARTLAAAAEAQIGALKLAMRTEGHVTELVAQLYEMTRLAGMITDSAGSIDSKTTRRNT